MRAIIDTSLQRRYIVVLFAAALLIFGIFQLRDMRVDVLPEYAPPYVEIQTEALGLATAEVEGLLTVPLEELLSGIPWLQTIRSKSVPGLSSIILVFEPGTDLFHARQLVRERLGLTYFSLPNVTKAPTMLQPLSVTSRAMMIGLSSKELTPIEMSVLARWNIKPRLMGIPDVANVSIWGQRRRQLQVLVDPEQLRSHGVTLEQVIESTGNALWFSPLDYLNASYPGTGGWIDTPQQRLGIRHVLPISAAEDLARVIIDGTSLTLGDTGQVVEDHPPLIGDAVLDEGPGLLLVIEKFPEANTLELTRQVDEALAALQLGLPGLEIDSQVFRAANFIEMALDNLTRALLIGGLLVVLVLALFLFDWRSVLVSVVAIPLSLVAAGLGLYWRHSARLDPKNLAARSRLAITYERLGRIRDSALALFLFDWRSVVISVMAIALSFAAAGLVLYWLGATADMMLLAGFVIALGAVIDDAIVDVETITRRIRKSREAGSDKSTATIVLQASLEVRGALFFVTLILLLLVVPILFMGGPPGTFFQPLALTYAVALLASMLVALTVTPALSVLLISRAPTGRQSPVLGWPERGYSRAPAWVMRKPSAAYAILALVALSGLLVLPLLRLNLLPSFRETDFLIHWEGAPGTSHSETTRLTTQASQELRAIPGVRTVTTQIGRAVLGDEVVGINSAEIWVSTDPEADYDTTIAAIREIVERYPGSVSNVQTYLEEKIEPVLTGASQAHAVRVYGPDIEILLSTASEIRQVLAEIDGIVDLTVEPLNYEPHVEITVDMARAGQYGLIPGDVRRAAAALVAGLEVGSLFEQQKVFDVVVWSVPEARNSLTALHELLIDTPRGGHVRLGDVAELRIATSLNTIHRDANSRRIDVGFKISGRRPSTVLSEVEASLQQIEFPVEYHPELIGGFAERRTEQNLMIGVVAAVAIGAYLLLQATLQSWRLALLVYMTTLAALAGGLLAAYVGGGVISIGSLLGLLAVLAVALRNSTLLVNHYRHLEQEDDESFGPQLVLRGSRERLAPILMTALATGLALMPFVLFGDIPGHEIARPMAVVILGGLVTTTLINLFVIPALYIRFGSSPEPDTSSSQLSSQPGSS